MNVSRAFVTMKGNKLVTVLDIMAADVHIITQLFYLFFTLHWSTFSNYSKCKKKSLCIARFIVHTLCIWLPVQLAEKL